MLFPWETFKQQAERERRERQTGVRWSDEFVSEIRLHVMEYASQLTGEYRKDVALVANLNETWRLLPYHMRHEIFEGCGYEPPQDTL